MEKILLSIAPVSPVTERIDPDSLVHEILECAKEGAAMVHLHVRDSKGKLTRDTSFLSGILGKVRQSSDIIIQVSTGGVSNLDITERCAPLELPIVETTTLNVGSLNLGDSVYTNSPGDVIFCTERIIQTKKVPEVEVFELGMIKTTRQIVEQFHLPKPILISIVLGHIGGAPDTVHSLQSMIGSVNEFFAEDDVIWGFTHANRKNFDLIEQAINLGARTIRVGFEDSNYLNEITTAKDNPEVLKELIHLLQNMGKIPMTPREARKLLGIKPSSI